MELDGSQDAVTGVLFYALVLTIATFHNLIVACFTSQKLCSACFNYENSCNRLDPPYLALREKIRLCVLTLIYFNSHHHYSETVFCFNPVVAKGLIFHTIAALLVSKLLLRRGITKLCKGIFLLKPY